MRILIACESSGIVRDAFAAMGHDAWSCDLLPSERPGNHIQEDVLLHLEDGWDLMIAHPPCTDLAVSGARYFKQKQTDGRQQRAVDFFLAFTTTHIRLWCIENPVGIMSTTYRKSDQRIQPWHFGDDASKKTCLWLKGLPLLKDRNRLPGDDRTRRANQTPSGQNKLGPSPTRAADRARTYQGIADAMAEQWNF